MLQKATWPGAKETTPADVIAASPAMTALLETARRASARDAKILITGESGAGKDVLARFIHGQSRRAHRPFVAVNCAALSETLLETELFGHVKGSFTGAYRDKPGKLQLAHGGTIFLDEIGEMTPRMQALLLRFLESGEVQPVGSDTVNRIVDTRVIAATHRNLTAMAAAGEFRTDLMYRIRVIQLEVPALRERPADIRPLAEFFMARSGHAVRLTEQAWASFQAYEWPGNVRELQNVVEQIASMAPEGEVTAADLPSALRRPDVLGSTGPRERRRTTADVLFQRLTEDGASFWTIAYEPFIERDLTRKDLRDLIGRGLAAAYGNYRDLVRLFNLPDADYKRLMNFLVRHDCAVDYRPFRKRRDGVSKAPPLAATASPLAFPPMEAVRPPAVAGPVTLTA